VLFLRKPYNQIDNIIHLMKAFLCSIGIIALSLFFLISLEEAQADDPIDRKCLIIVSSSGGYSSNEIGKASSFYDYLLESCTSNDVQYLTSPSCLGNDGPATLSNIEDAFEWLEAESTTETEVTVYVSDHINSIESNVFFSFDDGNMTLSYMDSLLDQVEFSSITMILNGERSGYGCDYFGGTSRDILCSMGSTQDCDPDLFNITRSLEDPTADTNDDNIVSYVEAFWKEVDNLEETGQDPVFYG
jgi:hypothetical protein